MFTCAHSRTSAQLSSRHATQADKEATVIRVVGHDRPDLLHILTGVLGELELTITSATARTTQRGQEGTFVFKVVSQDQKVRSVQL